MSQSNVKVGVRELLSRHVRAVDVKDGDDIFVLGLVSSLFAMQLVELIERRFNVELGPDDLSMDNFRSINAMAALVENKLGGARESTEGA